MVPTPVQHHQSLVKQRLKPETIVQFVQLVHIIHRFHICLYMCVWFSCGLYVIHFRKKEAKQPPSKHVTRCGEASVRIRHRSHLSFNNLICPLSVFSFLFIYCIVTSFFLFLCIFFFREGWVFKRHLVGLLPTACSELIAIVLFVSPGTLLLGDRMVDGWGCLLISSIFSSQSIFYKMMELLRFLVVVGTLYAAGYCVDTYLKVVGWNVEISLYFIIIWMNSHTFFFKLLYTSTYFDPNNELFLLQARSPTYDVWTKRRGWNVGFMSVKCYTKWFNSLLNLVGAKYCRLQLMWFDVGTLITALAVLPSMLLLIYTAATSLNSLILGTENEAVLQPVLPGMNLPRSEMIHYFLTLAVCTIVHETGHALAAVRYKHTISLNHASPWKYISQSVNKCHYLPSASCCSSSCLLLLWKSQPRVSPV